MNAVVAAVLIMLVLSLARIHVVVALIVGAVSGGLIAGLSLEATIAAFNNVLGAGAIGQSGLCHELADNTLAMVGQQESSARAKSVCYMIIGVLELIALSSQSICAIHIAFIPLVVPPLLYVMARLKIARRFVACA